MKALLYFIISAVVTLQAFSKTSGFPAEDITAVISHAKDHILKEKISVDGYFIQKVEFQNQYEELVPQFWVVTYVKVPAVKGGYLFVHVYNDGTIKHFFGE